MLKVGMRDYGLYCIASQSLGIVHHTLGQSKSTYRRSVMCTQKRGKSSTHLPTRGKTRTTTHQYYWVDMTTV